MKRIIITLIIFIFVFKVQSQTALDSLLVEYYNLATTSKDSNLYKEKYFEIFPDSFQLFDSIYGYHEIGDSLYLHPLYEVSSEHIDFFFTLSNLIDKNRFIKKAINISLNGYYKVDAINILKNNLEEFLLNNTALFLKELESYTDSEIKSFWHFFFDVLYYDHPYCIERHKKTYKKIKVLNYNRILTLMEEQYQYDYKKYLDNVSK